MDMDDVMGTSLEGEGPEATGEMKPKSFVRQGATAVQLTAEAAIGGKGCRSGSFVCTT